MGTKIKKDQFDLEYFFNLSPDLLCIAGYDGYFKKINPSVSKTLGYAENELLSAPINNFVHPNDRELTTKKREGLRNGESVFQFENRYLTKDGTIVWLFWTAIPIEKDQLIFAIAKDITQKKTTQGDVSVSEILSKLNTEQMQRFAAEIDLIRPVLLPDDANLRWMGGTTKLEAKDQIWLNTFEQVVRKRAEKLEVSLEVIASDMAISERQLFRQINRIMSTTPNKLVRTIRLHLAWEAIASRKYQTLGEIAACAGYSSRNHFKAIFQKVYGIDVGELL